MAKSTPIWYSIPEWYGIQQQVDGTNLPVTTAYDARNMETCDGNLSVAKGYTKYISKAIPGTAKILKLIVAKGTNDVFVVREDSIYHWDSTTNDWVDLLHFDESVPSGQVDTLQTKIGMDNVVLVATGTVNEDGQDTRSMVKLSLSTGLASWFGAGLYSYEGTVSSFDAETGTMTLSDAMDAEAQRRALAYGVMYGPGDDLVYVDVASIPDSTHIVLDVALVTTPEANDNVKIRGGGSNAPVQYIEMYANRLFAAGDTTAKTRLYWSAIPGDGRTMEDWLSVDGSQDASGGFVDVGDSEQDPIIGITALSNQLLIWKRYSVWRLYGDRPSTFTLERLDDHSDIMSNAGVVVKYDAPYLLMWNGIHTYNNVSVVPVDGGVKPLRRFFDLDANGQNTVDISNSRGAFYDNRFYMTCKTKTTPASTYDNAIIVFDVARNSYMIRDGFQVADIVAVGSSLYVVDGNRYVCEFERGSSYNGSPISAYWYTQPTDFGRKMNRHQAMELYAHITGDAVKATVIGDYLNNVKSVVPLSVRAGYTTVRFNTDQQYFIQFKFENVSGGVFTLHGGINIHVLSELKE